MAVSVRLCINVRDMTRRSLDELSWEARRPAGEALLKHNLNFFHPIAPSGTDTFNWHTRSPTPTRPGSIYNSWRDLVAPLREERGEFTPWPNYTLPPFAPSALRSSQKAECMTSAHSKVLSAFRTDGLFLKTNFPPSLSHTHTHLLPNTGTHTLAGSTYTFLWPSGTLDSVGETVEELWAPSSGSESFSALYLILILWIFESASKSSQCGHQYRVQRVICLWLKGHFTQNFIHLLLTAFCIQAVVTNPSYCSGV